MESLELLFADTFFRLSSLDLLGMLDLGLVAIVFFLLLTLVGRSQAGFLLRGTLVLVLSLLVITVLLPLPTFDWLVRATLLVMLVATPVILQPEIRRFLERIGRTSGLVQGMRQTTAEIVLPRLLHSVELLSSNRTGALIVLEGNESLRRIIDTGIPIESQVTQELIQTIFFDKTPLHDGAIVLRGDRIVSASCVLPLTEKNIHSYRRLGTRHRSAVGMSEKSDALIIVISEETGHISVAHGGRLHQRVDNTALRQMVFDFYTGKLTARESVSLLSIVKSLWDLLRRLITQPSWRQFIRGMGMLLLTAVLTVTVWSFVISETNPTARPQIDHITLKVENTPTDLSIVGAPPVTVSAIVRTTEELQSNLRAENFQAVVSLAGLEPGLHQLPVIVNSALSPVQIVSVIPDVINIELAPIISQIMAVTVDVPDQQNLPGAYEIIGLPLTVPGEIEMIGPESLINQVKEIRASVSVINATSTIRSLRPLRAIDENSQEISGITFNPAEVQVTLTISRRSDARDVGVRPNTEGTPPEGYWLSSLTASPTGVTLHGSPEILAEINGFIDTLPVDVSQAEGELSILVPLDLPPDVTAVDANGQPVQMVTVTAQIEVRTGDLLITRPINLIGVRDGVNTAVTPPTLDLLLSGPLPILKQIEADPDLVQLVVDVAHLVPIEGQSYEETPQVTAPVGIQVQWNPQTVLITMTR